MPNSSILIIPFSLESHLYPTFQTAKTLQKYGYQVIYATPAIYHTHVATQGFFGIELGGFPFGYNFEQENREFEKSTDLYLDVLIDKASNRIYEDRKRKLAQIITKVQPSVVLIDTWASTDFIILYPLSQQYGFTLAFMHLMLSTYRKQFSPPLFSPFLPSGKEATQKIWKQLAWQKKINNIKQAIKYLGHHDVKKIKQKFKENHLPQKHEILWEENPYNYAFAGVPEFVFSAEELEFSPSEKRPHQHYLGGIIYADRKQVDIDENYEMVLQEVQDKQSSLIY
nr:hypothetical protein [Thermoflexibacter sp.]